MYHYVGPIVGSHLEEGLWQLHLKKSPHMFCVWQHNLDHSTWWPLIVDKLCKTAQCLVASAPLWTHGGGSPVCNKFYNKVILNTNWMHSKKKKYYLHVETLNFGTNDAKGRVGKINKISHIHLHWSCFHHRCLIEFVVPPPLSMKHLPEHNALQMVNINTYKINGQ